MVIEKKAIQHHFLPGAEQFVKRLRDIWIIAEENLVMERDILSSRECVHWQKGKLYVVILDEGIVFFVIEGNAYIIFLEMVALGQGLIANPADECQLVGE
jgi:predicted ribosome-associated RNA-binding protein Tma20